MITADKPIPIRQFVAGTSTTIPISVEPANDSDLRVWLTMQAREYNLPWLLAHADDGVIWGELRDNQLALSCEAFPALNLALRWEILQQARLFGEAGELLLWQGPRGWQARLIHEQAGDGPGWYDEYHLLWGVVIDGEDPDPLRNNGFARITEGAQGIRHAPPIGTTTPSEQQRARLRVRHYIGEDNAGVARVTHSRLVMLLKPGENV